MDDGFLPSWCVKLILCSLIISASIALVLFVSACVKKIIVWASVYFSRYTVEEYDKKMNIWLYTRSRMSPLEGQILKVKDPNFLEISDFNGNRPTKMYLPGWCFKPDQGMNQIRDALLQSEDDFNVILVDWSQLDSIFFAISCWRMAPIAQHIGLLIRQLQDRRGLRLADLHLIGHSMGAHMAALASINVGLVGRITGLDPAGNLYLGRRLSAADANFVDVIHTCGNFVGYMDDTAHADFYPNRGRSRQPGCGLDVFGQKSHSRAVELLIDSVHNSMLATKCSSWKAFKDGECESMEEMGLRCSLSARGRYYLETRGSTPYSTRALGPRYRPLEDPRRSWAPLLEPRCGAALPEEQRCCDASALLSRPYVIWPPGVP